MHKTHNYCSLPPWTMVTLEELQKRGKMMFVFWVYMSIALPIHSVQGCQVHHLSMSEITYGMCWNAKHDCIVAKNIYTEKLNRLFASSAHICARQRCRKHIWNVVAMLCHKTWFQAWTKMRENICCFFFVCIATLCSHGDVRLVGGYTDHEGHVEVCINGILGTCLLQWMEYHEGFSCVQAAVWRKH